MAEAATRPEDGALKPLPLRVLVINFTLDEASPVLAWQPAVARAIARRVAAVHVFTESGGRFTPPGNLTFDVVPRWPYGVPRRLGSLALMVPRLRRIVRRFRPDACFIHMAHEWCTRIGPHLAREGVPILLWYAHGHVPASLHRAVRHATRIVTSTPEGFRIDTPKREIIGQAIDTETFVIPPDRRPKAEIVTVGRVSARKRTDLLVEAMAALVRRPGHEATRLIVVGPALTEDDRAYVERLKSRIAALGLSGNVDIRGAMEQRETARLYRTAALHVNVSDTGSMDKTVMEALACGCPVLTSNPAFRETLAAHPEMLIAEPTPERLAERMAALLAAPPASPETLRALVAGKHDLGGYADKIVARLAELAAARRGSPQPS